MRNLVVVDAEEQAEVKHLHRNLQKLCTAKIQIVPKRLAVAVNLAVKLVVDAVVAVFVGIDVTDPRIYCTVGQDSVGSHFADFDVVRAKRGAPNGEPGHGKL